jgi:molybdopterin molybdotransferase
MGKQFLEITEKKEVEELIAELSVKLAKKIAVDTEKVRIGDGAGEALGRIASTDIFSTLDIPPFDRATMDGYAVIASDTFYAAEDNPSLLIVNGYVQAGEFPSPSQYVEEGHCTGISTGAPLPKGANAVVKVENTSDYEGEEEEEENRNIKTVKIYKPVAPAEYIMFAGSDIKRGEKIVVKGTRLTPRETGVLAACGIREVEVRKKLSVAVISTGNELVAPGTRAATTLEPGKIYDVNAQTVCDSVREVCSEYGSDYGCVPLFLGVAKDNLEDLSAKLNESLAKGADVIIFSGGTSAGAGDLLPTAIEMFGEILVHGVDIKPGKPFILGMVQGKPVFGLPGNPTSALVTFNLFVAPLLRRISSDYFYKGREGKEKERIKKVKATAAVRIFSEKGRDEYVLVKVKVNLAKTKTAEEGNLLVYPILTGSGAITTLSSANGYIFVEKGKEIVEEGEEVEVEIFF